MNQNLKDVYKQRNVVVIDNLMDTNRKYIADIKNYYGLKVVPVDFVNQLAAAKRVNNFVSRGVDGVKQLVYPEDFEYTVMLLCDNVNLKSAWKFPFDPVFTKEENFSTIRGDSPVNMMSTTGYFNTTELPFINAKVLEIPCTDDLSMLIIMPIINSWIGEAFYKLQRTNLNAIFNSFKPKQEQLVTVKLPRFKIESVIDNLPELLYDMGIKEVFDPLDSDLPQISKYQISPGVMTQFADVEVIESGVTANATPGFLARDAESIQFTVKSPFAYLLVDRKTQFVLFGGAYSVASLY